MATTPTRGWPLPDHATQPPDVVRWLADGLGAADLDWAVLDGLINAVNAKLAYGPVSARPASLAPGHLYFGYEG